MKRPSENRRVGYGLIAVVSIGISIALVAQNLPAALDEDAGSDLRAQLQAMPLTSDLGGETTVDTYGPRAFRSIAANADNSLIAPFLFGQRVFDVVWDHDPVISPLLDGLGPMFNRMSCRECHEGNGRGHAPDKVGAPMKSMLIRVSVPGVGEHGGVKPVPNYGDQIQDRAVAGVAPEAYPVITYEEMPGEFADGTPFSLRKPTLRFDAAAYGDLPPDLLASPRVATPVIGLGLLQSVPEDTMRALADPDDANGDGVSGRVNMVWDADSESMAPGRFGWKANVASLRHQIAGAALGDMGLTSPLFREDLCEAAQKECAAIAAEVSTTANAPEIVDELFKPMDFYMLLLAVPRQRDADNPAVQRGEGLFRAVGCSNCHMPTLVTGQGELEEISNQTIHPFTDLLIHDMGEGLADGRPRFRCLRQRVANATALGCRPDV